MNNNTANSIGTAIQNANPGDTINLSAGTYREHYLVISKDLTITGPTFTSGNPKAVVNGHAGDYDWQVFIINNNAKVNLQNLQIEQGGAACGGGLSISDGCNVNIYKCSFTQNHAAAGSAIYNDGICAISNSNFFDNTQTYAIFNENSGILTITDSTLTGNPGAIYNYCGANFAVIAHYNQIYSNGANDIFSYDGYVNAENNWWGSNVDPSSKVVGNVDVTPWLGGIPAKPRINAIDPVNDALLNTNGKVVSVTFNENVLAGSAYGNISISLNGTPLNTLTKAINGNVLTLTNSALYADGLYTVNIPINALTDTSGNGLTSAYTSKFTVDTTPPTANASPKGGIYNAAKTVTLNMSEAGSIYYTTDGTTPTTSSSKYTGPIIISSTKTLKFLAVDLAGKQSTVYSQTYTIDKTAPKVSTSNPKSGKTGIKRNQTITVTFNENIKTGSNYSKITLKSSKGKTITISKSISGKVLTIKHSSKFAAKTKYILTLYSGCVRDLAGNPLAAKTITFTTGSS